MGCRADRPLPAHQAFRGSPSDRESPQATTRSGTQRARRCYLPPAPTFRLDREACSPVCADRNLACLDVFTSPASPSGPAGHGCVFPTSLGGPLTRGPAPPTAGARRSRSDGRQGGPVLPVRGDVTFA
jgi:hypothetical protein